jgi:hypothetical protein
MVANAGRHGTSARSSRCAVRSPASAARRCCSDGDTRRAARGGDVPHAGIVRHDEPRSVDERRQTAERRAADEVDGRRSHPLDDSARHGRLPARAGDDDAEAARRERVRHDGEPLGVPAARPELRPGMHADIAAPRQLALVGHGGELRKSAGTTGASRFSPFEATCQAPRAGMPRSTSGSSSRHGRKPAWSQGSNGLAKIAPCAEPRATRRADC